MGQFLEDVYMKPSQNSLFKADTYVRRVAESGILGLVHGITYARDFTPHCSFCVGSRGVTFLAIQQRLGFHSEHTTVCYVGSSLDVSDYREGASVSKTKVFEKYK
jgi:hypothetical protein